MRNKWTGWMLVGSLAVGVGCGSPAEEDEDLEECTAANAQVIEADITSDMTLDSCHRVGANVGVSATVTVSPGATVYFDTGAGLVVGSDGILNAVGTEEEPILFTGVEQAKGAWKGVRFSDSPSSQNVLEYVTIEYGGDSTALLSVEGESRISVRNSTLRQGAGEGFFVSKTNDATVDAFEANTVTENATAATVGTAMAGALADSNDFTGNDDDTVYVDASSGATLPESATYSAIGVPFVLIEGLTVNDGVTWTVEPGAEVAVAGNERITVTEGGVLVASGSSDAPITFRGQEAAAGFWRGIYLEKTNSPSNAIEHATIADAGGEDGEKSAAIFLQSGRNATVRLTINEVTIRDSGGWGIGVDYGNNGDVFLEGCSNISFESIAEDNYNEQGLCGS